MTDFTERLKLSRSVCCTFHLLHSVCYLSLSRCLPFPVCLYIWPWLINEVACNKMATIPLTNEASAVCSCNRNLPPNLMQCCQAATATATAASTQLFVTVFSCYCCCCCCFLLLLLLLLFLVHFQSVSFLLCVYFYLIHFSRFCCRFSCNCCCCSGDCCCCRRCRLGLQMCN